MSDEWGPWVEHIPGPCPLIVGQFVEVIEIGRLLKKRRRCGRVSSATVSSPAWFECSPFGRFEQVLRYRIRKPRGLTILENLIADLPVTEEADA